MKEKIKKEIQRRMENCECGEVSLAYSGLIEFIDNLPDEPNFFEKQFMTLKGVLSKLTDEEKTALASIIIMGGGGSMFGAPSLTSLLLTAAFGVGGKEQNEDDNGKL